jgi:transglutaminase-like putative cysteine protease
MRNFFLFFCLFVFVKGYGQLNYSVSAIPDSLKTDAQAIVRYSSQSFFQQDEQNGTYKVVYIITILNEKAKSYSDLVIPEDDFLELKNFSGEVYDATGKLIKKMAKKDLFTTAYSADLANSGKRNLCRYHSPVYPYTVKYEYEMKFKNGILFYPTFEPIPGYDVSLERAVYNLQIPINQKLRYKAQGTDIQSTKNHSIGDAYSLKLSGLKAISYEKWAPVEELFPIVYLSPDAFCVAGVCGSMTNWETFGQWNAELLKGRNALPPKTVDKVQELTQNVTNQREKVKILYDYLQKTTRYVGIQLGIGGWQPMKAEEVAKTGFGDCKALTNYMKSLLEVVDIPSYYTVIGTKKKRFFSDFPSFGQANHVILMVPLEEDTVYLECTSQQVPFGYVGSLAGHDALAISGDKAFFHTLPEYSSCANEESNHIQMQVDAAGTGNLTIHSVFKNEEFEWLYYLLKNAGAKESNDVQTSLLRVHKPRISQFRKEETLDVLPRLDVYFTVECEDFATQTGSRMFIPVNPSKTGIKDLLTGSSRKYDIVMDVNRCQNDTVVIQIPEGYNIESLPKAVEMESPYGYFKSDIIEKDGLLIYIQSFEIKKGRYSAAEFEEMKKFYNRIESLHNGKIGLKK